MFLNVRDHGSLIDRTRLAREIWKTCRPPWKATDLEDKIIIPSKGEDIVDHIPLEFVLSHLPNLVELYLNFGMIYMNDGFEWRDFE